LPASGGRPPAGRESRRPRAPRAKLAMNRGDSATAHLGAQQSLAMFREPGNRWGQLQAIEWLGAAAAAIRDRAGRLTAPRRSAHGRRYRPWLQAAAFLRFLGEPAPGFAEQATSVAHALTPVRPMRRNLSGLPLADAFTLVVPATDRTAVGVGGRAAARSRGVTDLPVSAARIPADLACRTPGVFGSGKRPRMIARHDLWIRPGPSARCDGTSTGPPQILQPACRWA